MSSNGSPGLIRMAASLVRAPFEERVLREEWARYQRLEAEAASSILQEVVRRVQPEDDEFTQALLAADLKRELDEPTLKTLRDQALSAWLKNPHGRGYLKSLKRFVMGQGPTLTPEVEDERLAERLDAWWSQFRQANDWDSLEDEITLRTWRDGEVFVRGFVHPVDGPPEAQLDEKVVQALRGLNVDTSEFGLPALPAGMLLLRLIPPEQITDPGGLVTHGIVTDRNDVQTVLGYMWAVNNELREFLPTSEVYHIKAGVDADVKRGRSQLEVILKRMKQYEDWLEYRIVLSLVRAAVVLVKKVEGATPSQLSTLRQAQAKQRQTVDNDRRSRMLKPGTTFTAPAGIEYEFKSPNVQAQDAHHDGRAILLNMAAATGLPEYMFTGDASNANFASTMVAESPAVREFEDQQDFFTPKFRHIYRWAMAAAASKSQIEGLSEEQAWALDVSVEFPPMMSRNRLEEAKADEIYANAGTLSKEGMARRGGIDWEVEKERLEQERQEAVEFTAPAFGE